MITLNTLHMLTPPVSDHERIRRDIGDALLSLREVNSEGETVSMPTALREVRSGYYEVMNGDRVVGHVMCPAEHVHRFALPVECRK